MRDSGRLLPVLAVALVVATVVLGLNVLRASEQVPAGPAAGATATVASSDTVELDRGATGAGDVADCLTPDFAADPADVTVLYGRHQATATGSAPVLVLRNRTNELRLCDSTGADAPAEAPLPVPSDTDPVVFLSDGRSTWSCRGRGGVLERYTSATWLATAPSVSTVRQRFWVDGVPGPWFTTAARDGYAHLQSWLEGPEPAGTSYAVEYRVLDADGAPVAQQALPTGREPLPGCGRGGSATIG